jgi:hypothetical protein
LEALLRVITPHNSFAHVYFSGIGLLPPEGFDNLEWSYWCATDGRSCGTYEVASEPGTQPGRVLLQGAGAEPWLILVSRDHQHSSTSAYDPFDRLDGLRLGSRYHADCFNGYQATIEFTRDGRFTEQQLVGCVDWPSFRGGFFDNPDEFHARKSLIDQRPGGSGSYTIQRNTLELRYSDGRTIRLAIHVVAEAQRTADPAELCLAERCLPRVQ